MRAFMYRSTSELFDAKKDKVPKYQGVVLLTDTNCLAYRDSLEPTGWGFVEGTLVSPDENGEFKPGEFTVGLNVQIRCDEGMVLFKGCQIVPTLINQTLMLSLVFH